MKKEFLKQLWIAFKIWVIALGFNTLAGSLCLVGEFSPAIMIIGLIFGVIFSFPIPIILLIVIDHCVSRQKSGLVIFRYVMVTGVSLTIMSAAFFITINGLIPPVLLVVSVLAACIGIGSQHGAFLRLADYDNEFQNFPS